MEIVVTGWEWATRVCGGNVVLATTVASFVAWVVMFGALWVLPIIKFLLPETAVSTQCTACHKIISLVHGAISALAAFYGIWWFIKEYNVTNLSSFLMAVPVKPREDVTLEIVMAITLGYFFADWITCALDKYGKFTLVDWVHHTVSAGQYVLMLYYRWGLIIPVLLQTNEMSTPSLNARWLLGHSKSWNGSLLHTLSVVSLGVLFILGRVIFASAVLVAVWYLRLSNLWPEGKDEPTVPPHWYGDVSVGSVSLYCLVQYFFFFKILQVVILGPAKKPTSGTPHNKSE
ncbi:hypothetical protein Pelo_10227 [Pelomyxa schiedti]|nr:hypothetical protein Pelo_10227 [Pelomyxa schiedti]